MPDVGTTGTNPELATAVEVRRENARRKRELAAWSIAMSRPRLGLDLTSGQQDFGHAGGVLAGSVTADDVDDLLALGDVPAEPYGRVLTGAHLRLSHTAGRPYAYQAAAPAKTPPLVRVAASWLSWRAIVAHPLLGSRHATPPHAIQYSDLALVWSLGGPWTCRSRITRDRYGYGTLSPAEMVPVDHAALETSDHCGL